MQQGQTDFLGDLALPLSPLEGRGFPAWLPTGNHVGSMKMTRGGPTPRAPGFTFFFFFFKGFQVPLGD